MKIRSVLLTVALVTAAASVMAQFTNTLSFSGASWNDGGSLNGYFTAGYNASGTPVTLVSADITTGNSTPGFYAGGATFTGFQYIYNVAGKANTTGPNWFWDEFFDASQNDGAAANELSLSSLGSPTYDLFLDWQGSTSMSLYLGSSDGEYTSEAYAGDPATRSINSAGGLVGPVPEPGTFALLGIASASPLIIRRRK